MKTFIVAEIASNWEGSFKKAEKLIQQIQYFMFDDSLNIKAVNDDEINEALELKGILSKSIDEMELSVRSHNCLQAAGIYKISELVSKDEGEMLK